jgi:hypothetical protein
MLDNGNAYDKIGLHLATAVDIYGQDLCRGRDIGEEQLSLGGLAHGIEPEGARRTRWFGRGGRGCRGGCGRGGVRGRRGGRGRQ